jgi:hypothetical protein
MTLRNLLLTLTLACAPACADTVLINFDSTTITASPGQLITFSGTIDNNVSSIVDLNNISVTLNGMFNVDISPFFALSSPATVAGDSTTVDFDFFNVTVDDPYTDPLGAIQGTLTMLGGIEGLDGYDPNVQDDLGSATFSVDVESAAPEPSAFVLLLTAAALVLLCKVWRRHILSA